MFKSRLVLVGLSLIFTLACGGQSSGPGDEGRSTVSNDDDDDDVGEGDAGSKGATDTDATSTDDTEDEGSDDSSSPDRDPGDSEPGIGLPDPDVPPMTPGAPPPVGTITPPRPPMVDPGFPPGECSEYVGASNTSCNYERSCSNEYLYSYCNLYEGKWQCQCNSNKQYLSYDLTGVNQDTACDFMLAQCLSDEVPTFTGEEACSENSYSDTYFCQKNERCGPSADLGDGVTAWRIESENSSHCYDDGAGGMSCSCYANNQSRAVTLSGVSAAPACDAVLDLCQSGIDVAGPEQCSVSNESEGSNYCSADLSCSQSVDLGNGVTAQVTRYRGTYCNSTGGQWSCSCSDTGISFNTASGATSGAVCTRALESCESFGGIVELDGPIECALESRSSGPDHCSRTDVCGQSAEVDGVELTLNGYVNVGCYNQGDGQYYCDCSSNNQYTSFPFAPLSSGRETCDAAMLQCQDTIEVQVGNGNGGGIGIPIPLPGRPIAF